MNTDKSFENRNEEIDKLDLTQEDKKTIGCFMLIFIPIVILVILYLYANALGSNWDR